MKYAARTNTGTPIVHIVEIKTGKVVRTTGTWASARRVVDRMNK